MNTSTNPYAGHRYPTEIISHAVWLYFRFALSFRDIEELLSARGIVLTYETVRQWSYRDINILAPNVSISMPLCSASNETYNLWINSS